jgi:hypothetical protein
MNHIHNGLLNGDQENKTGQETFPTTKDITKHLARVFQPHPSANEPEEEEALIQLLETLNQLEPPINPLKRAEV